MATVELSKVWIHRADDLAAAETFYSNKPGDDFVQDGEVRAYATGRLRIISRPAQRSGYRVNLRDVTDAQVETLKEWAGQLLLYRDPRGRMIFGSFFTLTIDEYKAVDGNDVSLTFQQVTHTVEV